jgi:hypothetical protein
MGEGEALSVQPLQQEQQLGAVAIKNDFAR